MRFCDHLFFNFRYLSDYSTHTVLLPPRIRVCAAVANAILWLEWNDKTRGSIWLPLYHGSLLMRSYICVRVTVCISRPAWCYFHERSTMERFKAASSLSSYDQQRILLCQKSELRPHCLIDKVFIELLSLVNYIQLVQRCYLQRLFDFLPKLGHFKIYDK